MHFKSGLESVHLARMGVPSFSLLSLSHVLIGLHVESTESQCTYLTGGILFLEQHKLVWEHRSENYSLKIID